MFEGEGTGVAEELVEECLGVEGDVMGGGEEAGVPGYSSHAAGGGVVDGAAEEVVEVGVGRWVGGGFVVVSGGGDPWNPVGWNPITRMRCALLILATHARWDPLRERHS